MPDIGRWMRWALVPLLVWGAWALFTSDPADVIQPPDVPGSREPDAFLKDATYLNYDRNGALSSRVIAERAIHYPDADDGELVRPSVEIYQVDAPPWVLRANRGTFELKTDRVYLEEQVNAVGILNGKHPVRFESDALDYFSARRFIETDQPVKITSDRFATRATGLSVHIDQKLIDLHHDVHSVVQP
ncbi:MAG: LPS export ABC transporter periplasmic protein LptC [Gammaproteobacteria bacterium]|nr:MAG: LPS export ABC transporter periplasmic protein LptC [Gammaproteobacteria bacterium]